THTSQNLLDVPSTNSKRRRPFFAPAGAAAGVAVTGAGAGVAVTGAGAGAAVFFFLAGAAGAAVTGAGGATAAPAVPAPAESPSRSQSSTSYRKRVPPCSTRLTDVLCTNTAYLSRSVGRMRALSPSGRPSISRALSPA